MFYNTILSSKVKSVFDAIMHRLAAFIRRWLLRVALVIGLPIAGALGVVCGAYVVALPHVHYVYSAAKLVYGESRGESKRGQKGAFATILVREADPRFPSSLHGVIFQPYNTTDEILQYNAMGDTIHEDLSDEDGQTILRRVTWWYIQYKIGIFRAPKEARGAHSYCTPKACEDSRDFRTYRYIGTIGNHQFYGDKVEETPTNLGLMRSPRPKPNPMRQSSFLDEQSGKQIDAIVAAIAG